MNDLISIIIPIYNNDKYLRECINSVVNQTYKNIEVILVNDGSTDNSLNICKEYEKRFENVYVLNQKNEGPSSARNNGITHAKGKYTVLIDSDDYVDLNMIEQLLKNNQKSTLVGIGRKSIENGKIFEHKYKKQEFGNEEYMNEILCGNIMGTSLGFLYKTNILKKTLYDEKTNYIEDIVFLSEYLKNVKTIKILDNTFYYIRINQNSITNKNNKTYSNIKSICYSIDKIKENYNTGDMHKIKNKEMFLIYYELEKIEDKDIYYKTKENKKLNELLFYVLKNTENKIEYKNYILHYIKIDNYEKWRRYTKKFNKIKKIKEKIKKLKKLKK